MFLFGVLYSAVLGFLGVANISVTARCPDPSSEFPVFFNDDPDRLNCASNWDEDGFTPELSCKGTYERLFGSLLHLNLKAGGKKLGRDFRQIRFHLLLLTSHILTTKGNEHEQLSGYEDDGSSLPDGYAFYFKSATIRPGCEYQLFPNLNFQGTAETLVGPLTLHSTFKQ